MSCPVCNKTTISDKPYISHLIHCYEKRICKLSSICIEYKEMNEILLKEYLKLLFLDKLKFPKSIFNIIKEYNMMVDL